MAATTLDRNTLMQGPLDDRRPIPMATGAVIPKGVMVAVATPSAGAVNAADLATHRVMGMSDQAADQTKGDDRIMVVQGVFLWGNNGSITAAHIGLTCTVVDNQTVGLAADTANDVIAGVIEAVEAGGVWVNQSAPNIAAT